MKNDSNNEMPDEIRAIMEAAQSEAEIGLAERLRAADCDSSRDTELKRYAGQMWAALIRIWVGATEMNSSQLRAAIDESLILVAGRAFDKYHRNSGEDGPRARFVAETISELREGRTWVAFQRIVQERASKEMFRLTHAQRVAKVERIASCRRLNVEGVAHMLGVGRSTWLAYKSSETGVGREQSDRLNATIDGLPESVD